MTTLSKRFLSIGAFSLGLVGVLAVFLAFFWTAGAQTVGDGLSGWAWSSNIGWIQTRGTAVNGDAFGVGYDSFTENFSGYAWSSNIGWIHFSPAGPYPAGPSHGVRFDEASSRLVGWARALSYGGGWDGWIKMSDTNHTVSVNGNGQLSGYAWGDDVVGWVDFSGVTCSGCGGDYPPPQDPQLTVVKSGTGTGVVASSPTGINCGSDCNERYTSGTSIVLTPSPAVGSTFSGWANCPTVDGNLCRLTITSDINIGAQFNSDGDGGGDDTLYNLGVTVIGSGTVTSNPPGINCGNDCGENYTDGTTVNLIATPGNGYVFTRWEEDCSGNSNCSVDMTSPRSVTAVFEVDEGDGGDDVSFATTCDNTIGSTCLVVIQCNGPVDCSTNVVYSENYVQVIPADSENPVTYSFPGILNLRAGIELAICDDLTTNNCTELVGDTVTKTGSFYVRGKEVDGSDNIGGTYNVRVYINTTASNSNFILRFVPRSGGGQ